MDHTQSYSDDYLRTILSTTKTIAMVGASPTPAKASYGVLSALKAANYDVVPVNPRPGLTEIQGFKVAPNLASIDRPIDIVDVFRPSEDLPQFAQQAVDIGAKVFWAQLGLFNQEAADIAESAGLKVVMNRCPKIELARLF